MNEIIAKMLDEVILQKKNKVEDRITSLVDLRFDIINIVLSVK